MNYFATYEIGGDLVRIWQEDGRGAGMYSCGRIICPAALGPRMFAFLTTNGVFIIDAPTGQTRAV